MLTERVRLPATEDDALDEVHLAVWEAVRRCFPPRATATQTGYGWLLVTWVIEGFTSSHFAAPVMIHVEPGLLLALWTCAPGERRALTAELEFEVRERLAGYDPLSRIPTCPVIELGE